MNTIGVRYRTTIFGTSHGPFVGCTIDGLRAGTPVDAEFVQSQLDRRRPGQSLLTSQRKEEDRVEFTEGIRARAAQVGGVVAQAVTPAEIETNVERTPVRCADLDAADRMIAEIEAARKDRDSVGGVIEAAVTGLPAGVGEPFFDSVESALAHLMFSIPAVKGIEFGAGFRAAAMRGSEHNDPFVVEAGRVVTATNHAGGILGGITDGMPVTFRVVVKPTASIARPQQSVDLETMRPTEVVVTGRHDPCIVPRAVPVVENAAAMTILDLMLVGGFI